MEEERYTKDLLACKQAITEASRLLVLFSPLLTLKVASYLKKEVSVNDPNDPCRKRAACLGKQGWRKILTGNQASTERPRLIFCLWQEQTTAFWALITLFLVRTKFRPVHCPVSTPAVGLFIFKSSQVCCIWRCLLLDWITFLFGAVWLRNEWFDLVLVSLFCYLCTDERIFFNSKALCWISVVN